MRIHSQYEHKSEVLNLLLKITETVTTRTAIGNGAIAELDRVLQQSETGKRVLLLCPAQPDVIQVAEAASSTISGAGYECTIMQIPDGEAGKTHEILVEVWTTLQRLNFERTDTIVAVGGGAVSDLAGFAASTYLRGINLVLVPTTLLAQVDAAIGGKTGINLASGKNLAGSFYFPSAVVVDPNALAGLPERQLRSGLGEIIKYALIEETITAETDYRRGPRSLLTVLQDALRAGTFSADSPESAGIIAACVRMKLAVVGKDPREKRLRRCLNLGHTLGHAIEKVSNYKWTHGEAVSIGLVFACRLAEKMGRLSEEQTAVLVSLLDQAALPTQVPSELESGELLHAMAFDKKRKDNAIKFVLPERKLGVVNLDISISLDQLKELL